MMTSSLHLADGIEAVQEGQVEGAGTKGGVTERQERRPLGVQDGAVRLLRRLAMVNDLRRKETDRLTREEASCFSAQLDSRR